MSTGPVFNGTVNAQNLVIGDMINSANNYIQNMSSDRVAEKELYSNIVNFLENNPEIDEDVKNNIASSVKSAAENPSNKTKLDLVEAITIGSSAMGAVGAIAKLAEFALPAIHHLLS